MQVEISMLMYGIYNVETLEKLINSVHTVFWERIVPTHLDHFMHIP